MATRKTARKTKQSIDEMPDETPVETSVENPHKGELTTREARARLGGMSASKFSRVLREFGIEPSSNDRGVLRYDAEHVEEMADRLGLNEPSEDPRDLTIRAQQDQLEFMRNYVELLQESERKAMVLLRDENDNIRKLRAEEQRAYLEAIVTTQEAIDRKHERELEMSVASAEQNRKDEAMRYLQMAGSAVLSKVGGNSTQTQLVTRLAAKLDDDDARALAATFELTKEEYSVLQSIRGKSGEDYDLVQRLMRPEEPSPQPQPSTGERKPRSSLSPKV